MTEDGAFIRLPEGDEVEPQSGLTGDELRALIRSGDIRAIPVKVGESRAILAYWRSVREYLLRQDRATSYKTPRTYEAILARFPRRHRSDSCADLVLVAGPFAAGEESAAERIIEELRKASREVEILFSRKSIWVAFRKPTNQQPTHNAKSTS
jgi:hypothetical protein